MADASPAVHDHLADFISSINRVVPSLKTSRIVLPDQLRSSMGPVDDAEGWEDNMDEVGKQLLEAEEKERAQMEQERKEQEERSNKKIEWINDPSSDKVTQWMQLIDLFPTLDPIVLAHVLEKQGGSLDAAVETILGQSESDLLHSLEDDNKEDDEWNAVGDQDLNHELRSILQDSNNGGDDAGAGVDDSRYHDDVGIDRLDNINSIISNLGSSSRYDVDDIDQYSPPPSSSSNSSNSSSSSSSVSGSGHLAPPLGVPGEDDDSLTRDEKEQLRIEFESLSETEKRKMNKKRQELMHRKLTNRLEVGVFWKVLGYSDLDYERESNNLKHLKATDEKLPYDPTPQRAYLSYTQRNIDIMSVQSFGSSIRNVVNPRLAERFYNRLLKFQSKYGVDSKEAKAVLAFHGTGAHNVESIAEKGLIIPGWFNGIKKANGSVYGTGIYCSPSASYAASYASGGKVFVLAVLLGKTTTGSNKLFHDSRIAISDQIWVIFRPSQVLPLYVIS